MELAPALVCLTTIRINTKITLGSNSNLKCRANCGKHEIFVKLGAKRSWHSGNCALGLSLRESSGHQCVVQPKYIIYTINILFVVLSMSNSCNQYREASYEISLIVVISERSFTLATNLNPSQKNSVDFRRC